MDGLATGVCVAAVTFAGGIAGLALHRLLPEQVMAGALRDMTGAVGGLLSLLTALVLGLLIWTAYGVYSGQATAVRTLAAQFLQLDMALADYGPEANAARAELRRDATRVIDELWGGGRDYAARNYRATAANLHARETYLRTLHPVADAQKEAVTAARQAANEIAQTRVLMAVALSDPVARPLVAIVVVWAALIFMGFGLMHAKTLDALAVMAIGAIAVGTAVYLLIDLSHPYSGLTQVSADPIREILTLMGK
jgi:hypothetical protein